MRSGGQQETHREPQVVGEQPCRQQRRDGTQRHEKPPGSRPEGEAERDGDSKQPVARHDVHLVEAEAEAEVDYNVRQDEGKAQPHEPALAATPYPNEEKDCHDSLHGIIEPPVVTHDHGTLAERVLKQVLPVQLYGLAEKVLNGRGPARRGNVGPLRESAISHRLAGMCEDWLARLLLAAFLLTHRLDRVEHGTPPHAVGD